MLTFKQKSVLEYIHEYNSEHNTSPTIKEITDHIGVNSVATIHQHLEALEDRGFIRRQKGLARAIEVTELAQKILDIEENIIDSKHLPTKSIDNFLNKIIKGDTLKLMKTLPDKSIDLIISDPPYNLSKGNSLALESGKLTGTGGDWQKIMQKWDDFTLAEYMAFNEEWLKESKRVLKPTGSMWVFGTYHNIGIINTLMQLLGIEIINEVAWYKRNAFPNLAGRRLTASHETLLWAHTGKNRDYYFNYEYSKSFSDSSDQLKIADKQMRTVWDIPNNKERYELSYGKHPTQKPMKICKRIVELSSSEGDVVLAPFSGAGTECLAAKVCGRDYIGFEIESEYVEISKKRLENPPEQAVKLL